MDTKLEGGPAAPQPAILTVLDRIDAVISMICKIVIVVTGTALLVLLAASVFSRYFFNFSLIWVGEVPERLFPWMITAGVALAAVSNSHVAVDLVLKKLPLVVRRLVIFGIYGLIIATYVTLTKVALDVAAITATELSPVLKLPGSHGYYAFALGAILVAFAAVTTLIRMVVTGAEPVQGSLGQEHSQ